MSCCGRKFIITEEEKLDIMKLYGLLLEGETDAGGYEIDFSNTFQSDISIIDYYIQTLQDKLSTNSKTKKYLSELKELKKVTEIIDMARKSSFEKIQLLLDILKKSYLIDNN